MAESFKNNEGLANADVLEKVKRLAEDIREMFKYNDTNKLYVNYRDIYPQIFYDGYTLEEFICKAAELKRNGVDRDIISSFQNIIQKAASTTITSQEIVDELLNWNDENNIHGLIVFNKIDSLHESHQIIYGVDGWYTFRRYYLGEYPKDSVFFIDECKKYFPELFFHERNKGTIGAILQNCSKRIVYYLSALNDKFRFYMNNPYHRVNTLREFSIGEKLDRPATPEGDASRKQDFTFDFVNINGETESVCCEPHMKLPFNNGYPGDMSYSNKRRIYFHEGKPNIHGGKILVGHIGRHL